MFELCHEGRALEVCAGSLPGPWPTLQVVASARLRQAASFYQAMTQMQPERWSGRPARTRPRPLALKVERGEGRRPPLGARRGFVAKNPRKT